MTLTVGEAAARIRSTLGSNEPRSMSLVAFINEVGRRVYNLRPWKFRERTGRLNLRADITLDNATWTEVSKTLTKTSAFADYALLAGDEFQATAGVDAVKGFYRIASRTSSNAIVLETSIGASADGDTDIDGTISLRSMALPSDFQEMLAIYPASSSQKSLELVPMETIIQARASSTTGQSFLAAVTHAQFTAGGAPVPRLELSCSASGNVVGAYSIVYRSSWQFNAATADNATALPIPDFVAPFYLEYLSLYVRAVENNDPDGVTERLKKLMAGPDYQAALARDGLAQAHYGPIQNGALDMAGMLGFTPTPTLQTQLLDPS